MSIEEKNRIPRWWVGWGWCLSRPFSQFWWALDSFSAWMIQEIQLLMVVQSDNSKTTDDSSTHGIETTHQHPSGLSSLAVAEGEVLELNHSLTRLNAGSWEVLETMCLCILWQLISDITIIYYSCISYYLCIYIHRCVYVYHMSQRDMHMQLINIYIYNCKNTSHTHGFCSSICFGSSTTSGFLGPNFSRVSKFETMNPMIN